MASPLGLSFSKRYWARWRVRRAAMLCWRKRAQIHYTQGLRRWSGLALQKRSRDGEYPSYADCSAIDTWYLWDATRPYSLGDFVNGASWRAGFTGTMVQHGQRVLGPRPSRMLLGDQVFYGGTFAKPAHVATYVGRGLVVSHGQEAGPLLLAWNYRAVQQVRRYIR